jgi:protein ImuB
MFGGLHAPRPLPSDDTLVGVARHFTPRLEVLHPSLLLLDLGGLGRLWPSPEQLGHALLDATRQRQIEEARLALATTRTTALVVARVRPGLSIVPTGQEAATLAPLPLQLLDLSEGHATLFRSWGLRTFGDLAALPAAGLAERLGPAGPRLARLARGEDDSLLVTTPTPEAFALALDLDWPIDGLEPLAFVLMQALEPLCQRLTQRERRAAALTLRLRLADGRHHERTLKPAVPTAEPRTWRTLLLLDLETHPPGEAVLGLTLSAEPTRARPVQFSLLERARAAPERLAEALARLHAFVPSDHVGSPLLLETHRPQAFAVVSFDPVLPADSRPRAEPARLGDPATRGPAPRRRGGAGAPSSSPPVPAMPRLALRAFRPPLPVEVALRGDGTPTFVSGEVQGAVRDAAGPWRASGDWWDAAWSREEWDIALVMGGVYRLFRDRLTDTWHIEGELD